MSHDPYLAKYPHPAPKAINVSNDVWRKLEELREEREKQEGGGGGLSKCTHCGRSGYTKVTMRSTAEEIILMGLEALAKKTPKPIQKGKKK